MEIARDILEYFTNWVRLKIRIHITEDKNLYFYEREIWWASLGANIGYEQNGKNEMYERPVLVLKKFNKYIFWGLPLTSQKKNGKYYFEIKYNGESFSVILSQLKLMSSKRLLRNIRTMPKEEFDKIRERIKGLI
ncbi:MAG: type II toxin-antitoxin system PemK/MazF family toxin [Patescibacteria group bacterium]|mgnify:CR=1 FL=1